MRSSLLRLSHACTPAVPTRLSAAFGCCWEAAGAAHQHPTHKRYTHHHL